MTDMPGFRYLFSVQNPLFKQIKSLQSRKGRQENGLFMAEGLRLVREICPPWELKTLILTETFMARHEDWRVCCQRYPEAEIVVVEEDWMRQASDTQHPQGVMALVRLRETALVELLQQESPFLVILEDLQDPGNAGTILRTADAAGADGILCSEGTADFFSPKVVRASMGSIFHLPVVRTGQFREALLMLQRRGVMLAAAHLQASLSYDQADYRQGCGILIGNEGNGLREETANLARVRISIPQPGRAESLNASVAAGILMYEVVRQRRAQ